MSRPVRGRSFKITKNQARGYGYAKARSMKPNPGVTTIAAINGRGAYAGRSARSVMSRHRPNARPAVARKRLTAAQKAAFKARMSRGRMAANRSTSRSQSASSRSNIKKTQRARKAWGRRLPRGKRVRVGGASYGSKPKARRLKAGVYIANRRKKAGSKTMARRRKKPVGLKKKRRSSKRRRTTTKRAAPRRKRRKTARKGKARRKTARKTTRRRARRSTKLKANRRRRHRRNPAKRRRSRKATAAAPKRRRRKSRRKGKARRVGTRKRRVSRRRRGGKRLKANRRRRSHRRNPRRRRAHAKNRRRSSRRKSHRKNRGHKANRRRHRRNGRRLFKMNGVGDVIKVGAILFGGFALHRVLSNVLANNVLPMLLPAPAAAPAATSGFDSFTLKGFAVNLGTAALTGFAVSKMVKNPETKKLILGGIVMSVAQTLITSLLQKFAPASFADALSGPEDGTAARLSAMYGMRGLGAGASIMPRYAAIGEYFREPMSGLGEYFREPMNGVGEYIAATSGIGTYEPNADLYQAAAGMGSHDYQGNHIDPSGDLDRQLTIAEAAAGVGALSPFEAAAGIGPMQAAAGMRGFGAVDTVPSGDTWIPGSTNPQLWAGVKAISSGQSASEMTPAGILQTDGGSGIFG